MATSDIKFTLPQQRGDKAAGFPESSYGATIVTLVLGGRDVIKASRSQDEARLITIDPTEIADVICEVKLFR